MERLPTTMVWNVLSQSYPNVGRLLRSDNVIHDVWQTADNGNFLTSSAGSETDIGRPYNIGQIQGISSWLAVFDQYRIKEIEVWITPSSSASSTVDNFRWLSVVDYDDASTPSFNGLLQYSNVTDAGRNEAVYRRFTPHITVTMNVAGSSVLAKNQTADWIDSAQPTATHFGIKVAMSSTATTVILAERVRFHLQFRNNF